jgi:ferredoxin like protein
LTWGAVIERLDRNRFEPDGEHSHIEVDQAAAKAAGVGALLVRICPANVYSVQADGAIGVTYQACLECGTCMAVAPPGTLRWHYPDGGMGVAYREG